MVKCSWSDSQSSSGDVHVFMSSFRRQTLKSPWARFSLCVVNETRDVESRLIRTLSNHSRGCQTLINLRRAASSRTHLVLQAYCLTDVDEINPLGIEIWYRTTRRFSILCGIEAIRSVPKKYWTRYPALLICLAVHLLNEHCATSELTALYFMYNNFCSNCSKLILIDGLIN